MALIGTAFVVSLLFQSAFPAGKLKTDMLHRSVAEVTSFSLYQEKNLVSSNVRSKRSIHKRDSEGDAVCQNQQRDHLSSVPTDFINKYTFANETKYSLALAWASNNEGGSIIVSVTEEFAIFAKPSTLYMSSDEGWTFVNISQRINNELIRKDNGLQNHPLLPDAVFVVTHSNGENSEMFRTTDGGQTFFKISLPFLLAGDFVFHPSMTDYILAKEDSSAKLYMSKDLGMNWRLIHNDVVSYKWSSHDEDTKETVYITSDPNYNPLYGLISSENSLYKSSDSGNTWLPIHPNIFTFGMEGKFLFISKPTGIGNNDRLMEVSTDGGKKWDEVQLPSLTEDRFYAILDMSEDLIFMHVDNPGDTGHGILYISDATGIVFSESLQQHLYPNFGSVTDFYRVQSMRGVYLASQLLADDSVRTVISFDRGGEWNPVKRPDGVLCTDESQVCSLQIHNQFSALKRVKGFPPLSVENAPGLILVHGHVASALQTTDADVFVSSDGGYSWRLIADQGGLLVAVPADVEMPNIVKFSTDEGRCWHEYKFTREEVIFRRLLTQPGNKAMTVAIWGYLQTTRQWKVFVIDFRKVIQNGCTDMDYEEWKPHFDNSDEPELRGCLLGKKETFMRLKKDSWCYNGYAHNVAKESGEICICTKADYDCDYGYYRSFNSEECVPDPAFKGNEIDICFRGHKEELVYQGYHKVPGDQCQGGFTPHTDKTIQLKEHCKEGDKHFIEEEENKRPGHTSVTKYNGRRNFFIAVLVVLALMALLVGTVILVKRYSLLKRRNATFQYSSLQTGDLNDDGMENGSAGIDTSLYEDSSDEESKVTQNHRPQSYGSAPQQSSGSFDPFARLTSSRPASSSSAPPVSPKPTSNSNAAPNHFPEKVKGYHDDSDEDLLE